MVYTIFNYVYTIAIALRKTKEPISLLRSNKRALNHYSSTTYAPCGSNGVRRSVAQPSISLPSASATAPVCS
jgi:hypothetical protein